MLNADALASATSGALNWNIPLPVQKPFRDAKLRIDAENIGGKSDARLVQLNADAGEARQLVVSNPSLSINQVALKEGHCRKQMTKQFSGSWLIPRIVESIMAGSQQPHFPTCDCGAC